MKVSRTNTKEISSLMQVLNEVEQLHEELRRFSFDDINWDEFEILGKYCRTSSKEDFLEDLLGYLAKIHFQRILLNCDLLLEQASDPELSHLDFNKDIKEGLELLESKRSIDAMLGVMTEEPVILN